MKNKAQKQKRNAKSQELARKRTIKKRGQRCEKCGYDGYVELHHIIEVKDGGTHDDANLMVLCEVCHCEAHGWKKKKYFDKRRKYWAGVG